MEKLLKYCLSLCLLIVFSCNNITKDTFHLLTDEDKKALSERYTNLAGLIERGSPKHMRLLEKAVKINPQNDKAWRELSLPYLYAGMLKEWHYNMDNAIKISPETWQGWRAYDRLFYFRDYAGALFDLDATDTLTVDQTDYPQNTSVDFLRGLCYLGLNNEPMSVTFFNKYIEDDRIKVGEKFIDETAFLYLGIINLSNDEYNQAIINLERGIQYEEGYSDFHYHLSKAYCYAGDMSKAIEHFKIAKKKFADKNQLSGFRYEAFSQLYPVDYSVLESMLEI